MKSEAKKTGNNTNDSKVVRFSRKPARFVGLMADARALGVHRNHLYLVLSGRRKSADLMKRYRALKRTQG